MTTLSPPAATPKLPAIPGRKGRPVRRGAAGWLPVAVLPVIAWVATRDLLPEWGFMWAMCFVLYAGCKWLTLADALFRNPGADRPRILAYLLTWPGMDATAFLHGTASPGRPAKLEWVFAFGKFFVGVVLTWGLALLLAPTHPFLAGWVGMVGLIFVLHFGAFHLLSLAWRRLGVRAEPLMRAPVLATSLAEFWGRRWNAAFHELVHRYTFRPLVRAWGTRGATLLVFLVSGLIHELVISVPARGGFGGPTAYFLVNGAGLLLEHSRTGRRWGLGAGWRGRAFALVTVAAPVGLLCHPPFVHHVILPFLHAIGAT